MEHSLAVTQAFPVSSHPAKSQAGSVSLMVFTLREDSYIASYGTLDEALFPDFWAARIVLAQATSH
jgi:hypothetical protein